jgi:hypothetical protein
MSVSSFHRRAVPTIFDLPSRPADHPVRGVIEHLADYLAPDPGVVAPLDLDQGPFLAG